MSDQRYHINVFWSADDECWVADVPDLRHCTSHGDTPDGALANVQDAMRGWLEVASEQGMAIPEPRYRPVIYSARFAA